ncbi:MAG: phosphotransferase [Candidatus Bathyarchaeia archaeon]
MDTEKDVVMIPKKSLEAYFSSVFGEGVHVIYVSKLGEEKKSLEGEDKGDLKGFGYGAPYLIVLDIRGRKKKIVLETMRTVGGFGHDHFSDRAAVLLWQHSAFNKLPYHVGSIDVGAFAKKSGLKSLGDCEEFFILTEYVEGRLYHEDLDRLKKFKQLKPLDLERCRALSDYLVEIHKTKNTNTELYVRRTRDLVGHGECIMGLTDSYPTSLAYISEKDLMNIEKHCVEWRWKLKHYTHRLAQVHGDYHPWNILFHKETDFTILDRSRGEWGEPADDVSAMTINYLFYSLQTYRRLADPFDTLFNLFWKNYLDKTSDEQILSVIQPFFAWRSLVVASPIWYPNLPEDVRTKLFNFIENVLDTEKFDLKNVSSYFK